MYLKPSLLTTAILIMTALLSALTTMAKSYQTVPMAVYPISNYAKLRIRANDFPVKSVKKTAPTAASWGSLLSIVGGKVPTNKVANKRHFVKVVTDIDDTVVSSGGVELFGIKLGGVDNRFKRGQFYPGAVQFALELSRNLKSKGSVEIDKVAVLTARAREFKFALALKPSGKLCSKYSAIGSMNGLEDWGIGEVYYGSVAEWIFQWRKGIRKFKNFEIMMSHDELKSAEGLERQYILIGDTGEKDEEAGEKVALKHPNKMRAIFMHHVYNALDERLHRPFPKDRVVNGVPIYYFRTYVGAAVKAYENKLIDKDGLKRIASRAMQDLQDIDNNVGGVKTSLLGKLQRGTADKESRWSELKKDIESCAVLRPVFSKKIYV